MVRAEDYFIRVTEVHTPSATRPIQTEKAKMEMTQNEGSTFPRAKDHRRIIYRNGGRVEENGKNLCHRIGIRTSALRPSTMLFSGIV
jgi:hypothetical protein